MFLKEFVSEKSLWLIQYVNQNIPLITMLGFHSIDGKILYLGIELKAVVCNLRKKTLEVFCNFPDDKHWSSMHSFLNYVLPSWPTLIHSFENTKYLTHTHWERGESLKETDSGVYPKEHNSHSFLMLLNSIYLFFI